MDNLIFDSHAHYDSHAFDEDRDRLLAGLALHGVGYVTNISAGMEDLVAGLDLTEKYDFVYATTGAHPSEVRDFEKTVSKTYDELKRARELEFVLASFNKKYGQICGEASDIFDMAVKALNHPKVMAVGEIGLDYHFDDTDKPLQKKWFEAQMNMALEYNYPVVIHSRDAAADTYDMMKAFHMEKVGGVVHCFSYSKEVAKQYLDMGFFIGVGGVLTFKNGRKLKEVVEFTPIDRIVLETDCPYLAPEPLRAERNDSSLLSYVVTEIARIKNLTEAEVVSVTTRNSKRLYRM